MMSYAWTSRPGSVSGRSGDRYPIRRELLQHIKIKQSLLILDTSIRVGVFAPGHKKEFVAYFPKEKDSTV
ncbi:hypothetical protein DPEC_G00117680 [Dallia pectoralis]|uniref:Uncharacterized protein n=1 Tax=Dallia pectoralis TaxID=75939 RepID=A0ACC2GV99_DALPE|nr:hypothetical protein DPEC_G00117680 [Dallia pectoralis]